MLLIGVPVSLQDNKERLVEELPSITVKRKEEIELNNLEKRLCF